MSLDSTTWAVLAMLLTAAGLALSVVAHRRRGPAAGLRGLAWSLLPVAAWLTGTLRLLVEIVGDVTEWATRLVFSPVVWAGIVVAGLSVVLFGVSAAMRSRGVGVRRGGVKVTQQRLSEDAVEGTRRREVAAAPTASSAPAGHRGQTPVDDDMAEIEAILKKHGI